MNTTSSNSKTLSRFAPTISLVYFTHILQRSDDDDDEEVQEKAPEEVAGLVEGDVGDDQLKEENACTHSIIRIAYI